MGVCICGGSDGGVISVVGVCICGGVVFVEV